MSFAKEVKEELVKVDSDQKSMLAELSGLIQLNTELTLGSEKTLWFKSNSAAIARRFLTLLKKLYKVETSLLTKTKVNLNHSNQIAIGIQEDLESIILEHGLLFEKNLPLITQTPETKCAYLRGAFLAGGSVNHPKTSEYHLEIGTEDKDKIIFIQRLMNELGLNAKITKRRNKYIAYIKNAELIADFLRLIGANQTVFYYEEVRIKRDFNNSINRVLNCEIANEKKTLDAAYSQLNDIQIIQMHQVMLPLKLKQVADLRIEYEEASLKELVEIYKRHYKEKITRSGLNHRFLKIKEIAESLSEKI